MQVAQSFGLEYGAWESAFLKLLGVADVATAGLWTLL